MHIDYFIRKGIADYLDNNGIKNNYISITNLENSAIEQVRNFPASTLQIAGIDHSQLAGESDVYDVKYEFTLNLYFYFDQAIKSYNIKLAEPSYTISQNIANKLSRPGFEIKIGTDTPVENQDFSILSNVTLLNSTSESIIITINGDYNPLLKISQSYSACGINAFAYLPITHVPLNEVNVKIKKKNGSDSDVVTFTVTPPND